MKGGEERSTRKVFWWWWLRRLYVQDQFLLCVMFGCHLRSKMWKCVLIYLPSSVRVVCGVSVQSDPRHWFHGMREPWVWGELKHHKSITAPFPLLLSVFSPPLFLLTTLPHSSSLSFYSHLTPLFSPLSFLPFPPPISLFVCVINVLMCACVFVLPINLRVSVNVRVRVSVYVSPYSHSWYLSCCRPPLPQLIHGWLMNK